MNERKSLEGITGLFIQILKDRHVYILLFPWFALYVLYTILPITASWYYSLLDWNGFDLKGTFVGLANYKEVLQDKWFWNAVKNTFLFMMLSVPLRVFVALVLAVLLNSKIVPFRNFFRTMFFTPVVTTGAIIGIVMGLVLDPAGGPVNIMLQQAGLIKMPINFLGEATTAFPSAIVIWSWKWLGITLIYWLAALQTIPTDVYEAAEIDGAGRISTFFYITIPLVIPFAIIIVLITAVEATRIFPLMLTLTGGGPFFATEVIEIYIYRHAFLANIPRLGYASSAGVLFGLLFIVFAIAQTLLLKFARQHNQIGE
jgi:multiple sugar transport system permease protein